MRTHPHPHPSTLPQAIKTNIGDCGQDFETASWNSTAKISAVEVTRNVAKHDFLAASLSVVSHKPSRLTSVCDFTNVLLEERSNIRPKHTPESDNLPRRVEAVIGAKSGPASLNLMDDWSVYIQGTHGTQTSGHTEITRQASPTGSM